MTETVSLYPSTSPEPPAGEFVSFPDSPFELFMPYPPAGDQPEAIRQLVEGVNDGEVFQKIGRASCREKC